MRIPRTLNEFKRWARKPRVKVGQVASIASCLAYNMKRDGKSLTAIDTLMHEVAWTCHAKALAS